MRSPILAVIFLIPSSIYAQLAIRAVVNDSSPDGRLCPGCYGTVHYTPLDFSFSLGDVIVTVNGQRALVNPGGDSEDVAAGGVFRILLPLTVLPGPATVAMETPKGVAEPLNVTLDPYSPGLTRFDRTFSCAPLKSAAAGDVISIVATGLGVGTVQPSITLGGKPAEVLPPSPAGTITAGESWLTFRAPREEGFRQVVVTVGSKSSNPLWLPVGSMMINLSGASWTQRPLAPSSIVTAISCGRLMGPQGTILSGDGQNPPNTLGTATVKVRDSAGVERAASILGVGGPQVNYIVPAGTSNGLSTVTATASDGTIISGDVEIRTIAPGLFGSALLVRLRRGVQTVETLPVPISAAGGIAGQPGTGAIDMGLETDEVYLVLFGTGIRNRSLLSNVSVDIGGVAAAVEYAGAQGAFAGLDQVNVKLPRSLARRGDLDLTLTVDGQPANLAHLSFY